MKRYKIIVAAIGGYRRAYFVRVQNFLNREEAEKGAEKFVDELMEAHADKGYDQWEIEDILLLKRLTNGGYHAGRVGVQ